MKRKYEGTNTNQPVFFCLDNNDVITANVSDHHPVIHNNVLFWNIMMQGNIRSNGEGFNNGFGIIESSKKYIARLIRVARVIAEMVSRYPIDVISLCEGPIKPEHLEIFSQSLMTFTSMTRFMKDGMFHKPTAAGQNWGLLMLADTRYAVTKIHCDSVERLPKLANRFQLWQLEQGGESKYLALAHFPFAGDEHIAEKMALSVPGQEYCRLINTVMESYSNESLIFCADFNLNPYLINRWQDRILDKIPHNNSILLTLKEVANKQAIETVTVDGVLLSRREKQKYNASRPDPELFSKLKSEYRFFKSHVKRVFTDLMQREQDKQVSLDPYYPSVP